MKIGLLASTATSILGRSDNDEISAGDRGRRFINSLLYRSDKPQEISLALAIFGLLNGGSLFFFSHEKKRIKLEAACACYPNSSLQNTPVAARNVEETEYVSVGISLSQLQQTESDSPSQAPASSSEAPSTVAAEPSSEIDGCINLCVMDDYWHRPVLMEEMSYIDVMETYFLKQGKAPPDSQMMLGHPMPEKRHWALNPFANTGCAIIYGKGLPNIYDEDINIPRNREYYFKGLLVLFKPHRRRGDLLGQRTYVFFIHNVNSTCI